MFILALTCFILFLLFAAFAVSGDLDSSLTLALGVLAVGTGVLSFVFLCLGILRWVLDALKAFA